MSTARYAANVLVCGSRYWRAQRTITEALDYVRGQWRVKLLIHGAARGADTMGATTARNLGIPVRAFPAQWTVHGKAAGSIRNQQMLDEGRPDLVLAFHEDPGLGRGTHDMVARALRAGVQTFWIDDAAVWRRL